MKVKEALKELEKKKQEYENLQKLEKLFANDDDLAEDVAEMAGCNIPLYVLFAGVKAFYSCYIMNIDNKIGDLEIDLRL